MRKQLKLTLVAALLGLGLLPKAATEDSSWDMYPEYDYTDPFETDPNGSGVKSVSVSTGDSVDRVKLSFFDGEIVYAGGIGGRPRTFDLPENDCITQVSVWAAKGTNALQFHTKNGLDSRVFGNRDGSNELTVLVAPPGDELVGMYGSAGKFIETIEFKWSNKEKVSAERKAKRQAKLRESLKSILAAMMEEDFTLDDVAFEWGNCEKAAAAQKLIRQSQLKESLRNLLAKMKKEDVTLDAEELGMTDLCNTDERYNNKD